jgi:hypothetical protein
MPEGAVLAGITALRHWCVALPDRLDRDRRIHVLTQRGVGRTRRSFIAPQHDADSRVRTSELGGMPVVDPVDAWLQAAADGASHAELVQMGDGLIRYKDPLTTVERIAEVLERRVGRRGTVAARVALADLRPGTESIKETELRQLIVAAGLPEPRVQVVVLDQDGNIAGRTDLGLDGVMVLMDYDGAVHLTESARRSDNARRRRLEQLGYRLIVATADDLANPRPLIRAVEDAIRDQIERYGLE